MNKQKQPVRARDDDAFPLVVAALAVVAIIEICAFAFGPHSHANGHGSITDQRIARLESANAELRSELDSERAAARHASAITPLAGDHVSRWLNLGAYRALSLNNDHRSNKH